MSLIVDHFESFRYGPQENYFFLVRHCMLQSMAVKLKKPYYCSNYYIQL